PRHAELFHRPQIGAMVQLAGQEPMAPPVPREEDHVAPCQPAREELIAWLAKRRFNREPFLVRESFDVIKPTPANDADAMRCHTLRRSCKRRLGFWRMERGARTALSARC